MIGNIPEDWILNALRDNEPPNGITYFQSSSGINLNCTTATDADGFLPLEDELARSYFAEHITGPLPLSKGDISALGKCLQ